ncbi:hypothetical protein AsFPU1_0832 [Aphanothece sacrum FPU1]|uniref:DUF433 domain-containing protein n=2 Tax=Aphanothece sacrum TaxID=1122 RepID=A0A401IDS8_APHSA|nr:hypothetical protein AsFPU1_0832 [Aphanothece sacrum FPU1]GBF86652.1 hypothetical protein AsFPU3_3724 [Aphanothece sacrum FPU3]
MMQLEDYFNFLSPNDIRLKGTRIGIETILYDYIYHAKTPEEITKTYPSLNLEQVYATILYYLHDKENITNYLTEWIEHGEQMRERQKQNPPPVAEKLRKLREQRKISKQANDSEIFIR